MGMSLMFMEQGGWFCEKRCLLRSLDGEMPVKTHGAEKAQYLIVGIFYSQFTAVFGKGVVNRYHYPDTDGIDHFNSAHIDNYFLGPFLDQLLQFFPELAGH